MVNLRRSLVITFLSSSGATLLQFVASIVLARLLSPQEIGVFSITVVFVNIAHIFRDFGVTTYLQSEAELTPEKIRAAIGLLVTTSWFIAITLFGASDFIAVWFKEPAIAPVMRVLALGFLFIPFGSVTHALLTREFAADKQALVTIAGTTSFAVSCVGLAYLGFGTMSLAWGNFINIIVCAIAYVPLRPPGTPWLPSFRNWGRVFHFGMGSLISNTASAVNNAIPDLLLAKLAGARQVGLFSRANSTVTIFGYVAGATVNYGAISYVSQAHHRGESLTPLLNKAVAMLTGLGWPVLGVTAVLGKEIVTALYGDKWLDCVVAIPALTVSAAISMLFNYTPAALTAIGRPYLSAIPTVVTIAARLGFGWLLFDGTLGAFSWAICVATIAAAPMMLWLHHRFLAYSLGSILKAIVPSVAVTVICIGASLLLRRIHVPGAHPIVQLLVIGMPIIPVWYLALRLTGHSLLKEVHHFAIALKNRLAPS